MGQWCSVCGDSYETTAHWCAPPITAHALALEGIATRERAATIEAAARKLLEALPRCGLLHDDEEGVPFGCDKLATHAGVCDGRDGYACGPCRCKTCKPLKWADAARELEKALDGGER